MSTNILVSKQARVCTITLNRPEVLNALNHALFEELAATIDELSKASTDEVGCVILRGAGKAFSAGHDLNDINEDSGDTHSDYEASVIEALASLPMPVIGQVHGYCFTGALELALACDLIFIDSDTQLADTHSKWGLSPIWGMTQRLPRRIGHPKTKDMMFSSRMVASLEALDIGLVDRVFDVGALDEQTQTYAQLVAANSPFSHRICKLVIAETDGMRINDGLDFEYTNSPGACDDMKARITAFAAKKA